jgi:hypothetical protein
MCANIGEFSGEFTGHGSLIIQCRVSLPDLLTAGYCREQAIYGQGLQLPVD